VIGHRSSFSFLYARISGQIDSKIIASIASAAGCRRYGP
jgi:hypothetical protein